MRHIQSLMYRSLRHRLIQDASLAPLASKCKLSKSAIAVVDSVYGDIYGAQPHVSQAADYLTDTDGRRRLCLLRHLHFVQRHVD